MPQQNSTHLEPARHLAERVGEHLAVLLRQDLRDLLALVVQELADREEELGAPGERHRPPGRERLLRGLDRLVDLLDRREIDRPRLLPRRRVEHRAGAAGLPRIGAAGDPVIDRLDCCRGVDDIGHGDPPRVVTCSVPR